MNIFVPIDDNVKVQNIDVVNELDLDNIVLIRNEEHTVMQAINRQLTHYPFHVGQIVFLGKLLKNSEWKCLSVPRGKSEEFNKKMLSKSKTK